MIRRRQDYRYVYGDLDKIIIDGGIYPLRNGTGTAAKKCLRGEDIAYLMECGEEIERAGGNSADLGATDVTHFSNAVCRSNLQSINASFRRAANGGHFFKPEAWRDMEESEVASSSPRLDALFPSLMLTAGDLRNVSDSGALREQTVIDLFANKEMLYTHWQMSAPSLLSQNGFGWPEWEESDYVLTGGATAQTLSFFGDLFAYESQHGYAYKAVLARGKTSVWPMDFSETNKTYWGVLHVHQNGTTAGIATINRYFLVRLSRDFDTRLDWDYALDAVSGLLSECGISLTVPSEGAQFVNVRCTCVYAVCNVRPRVVSYT